MRGQIEAAKAGNLGSKYKIPHFTYSLVSGFGQYHTNEPGALEPKPYFAIDINAIRALVDNPQADYIPIHK